METREIARLRAALADLPSPPWRAEESTRDRFGAATDTGEVPSFVFRNCNDRDAAAIVEIINAAPSLLEELDQLREALKQQQASSPGHSQAVASAQRIVAFVQENGTLPKAKAAADSEEDRLYRALTRARLLARRGELEKAASRVLDKACPGWADGNAFRQERAWRTRRDEIVHWMKTHKRAPHYSSGDKAERQLAGWVAC
ncbi:UNVERIFIED_ORG: hypothetical protein ABIB52_000663 [Arthrobacter sp. UYCu721]